MTNSPNKKRYNAEYASKNFKRVSLDFQKPQYEQIKTAANQIGIPVATYIKESIKMRMEKEKDQ